jgi:hypothetical protein
MTGLVSPISTPRLPVQWDEPFFDFFPIGGCILFGVNPESIRKNV